MNLRFKKLTPRAYKPFRGSTSAAGWDLTCTSREYDSDLGIYTYGTSIAMAIPEGFAGFLFPRSSVYKKGLRLCNSVGVVDSDYRGEIMFKFDEKSHGGLYEIGDRVGQIVFIRIDEINDVLEVDDLDSTERGEGGFGSSGK